MSIKQLDRFVLWLALALIPAALYAQDADRTPALLKGGLVRQLRSLSEDALQKLRGPESEAKGVQNVPTRRATSPPSMQDTRRSTANRSPAPAAASNPSARTRRGADIGGSSGSSELPEILSSAEVRNRNSNRVYVETELPPGVVRNTKVPARSESQQSVESRDYPSIPDTSADGDRFTDFEESNELQPPRVSRVPLPRVKVSDADTVPVAEKQPPAEVVAEKQPPRTPSLPTSSVSVPTNLVAGPAIEQKPRPLAATGRISADAPTQELPALPSSMLGSTVTAEPPVTPQTSLPVPSIEGDANNLTVNRSTAENSRVGSLTSKQPAARAQSTPPASQAKVERLRMEAPRIQVLLNGPADLPLGVPAEYEVIVRNDDSIDLHGLMLRLDIPAGVQVESLAPSHGEFDVERSPDGMTLLTWVFDYLAAGQTATAPIQFMATSSKNFAVAMEWTLVPIAADANVNVLAPRIELALEGPAEVSYGQPKVYRLHVRNPGNATATQVAVQLSAEPYGSSSTAIGEIAPGEEEVIDVELTFNQRGAINISAEATAQGGLTSSTQIDVLVRQATVEATVLAPAVVYAGAAAEYFVRLSNSGDADATQMEAVMRLPAGAELVSAPPAATQRGNELIWPVTRLAAGGSEEFAVSLRLAGEGKNTVHFDCTAAGETTASCLATTQVEAITDLKLLVNDPVAPAPVGGEVVYELSLTNRGSKAATNVKVVAQFSEGIEPIRGEGQAFRVVPGQVFFDPIPQIGAGESLELKVVAAAEAEGVHLFRVEVRSDATEVRLVQEESTQYLNAASRIASPVRGSVIR
jgi:uncharacterized repeat protein (TIGR01451 family)